MIKLRKLENRDIEYMLEWMHDEENKQIFQTDFCSMTREDVQIFINNSFSERNQHFAIVDALEDEYLGTISLKNIDYVNKNAEYAISTRKKIRGTGTNQKATELILEYAFNELGLEKVYLCVLETNIRAQKFYKKCGFKYEGKFIKHIFNESGYKDLLWYYQLRNIY